MAFLEHFRLRYALGSFPVIVHSWFKAQTKLFVTLIHPAAGLGAVLSFPAGHEQHCSKSSCASPFSSTQQQRWLKDRAILLALDPAGVLSQVVPFLHTGDLAGSQCKMSCSIS